MNKKVYIATTFEKLMYNIIMVVKTATSHQKFDIPEIIGIGGVTTVTNDLFKISIEEAIAFLESFKNSVNEKLKILHEIDRCKAAEHFNKSGVLKQDEIKAQMVFETLQKELQSWLFGKGGVSLNKN